MKNLKNYNYEYFQILDTETGNTNGIDEVGEICVKSPFQMFEYLERPEETKKCFTEDGFIRTGDLGKYDSEGRLIYVDRMKALIKQELPNDES